MRGVIWLVLLFTAAVVSASVLGPNDGLVSIYQGAWRVDLSLNLFLLLLLEPWIQRQTDGVAGICLCFGEVAFCETKTPVVGLKVNRAIVQLHTNPGSTEALEYAEVMLGLFFAQADYA